MSSCCSTPHAVDVSCGDAGQEGLSGAQGTVSTSSETEASLCASCGQKGREVDPLTVKSLLLPQALATLDISQHFRFCSNSACNVVYFGHAGQQFFVEDMSVPVFQKDACSSVPVCYCFGWTRERIREELSSTGTSTAATSISAHIKAGRCACEVNNPQGSCCLGNVATAVKEARQQLAHLSEASSGPRGVLEALEVQ
jgi:hypothetical protein